MTVTLVDWERYADTIAALRDEDYSTEEIEEELGVCLCRCGLLPMGHPGEDCFAQELAVRREVKPEVMRVVKDHFRPDQVDAVLFGPEPPEPTKEKFAAYRDDLHWLERELDDWPQGAKRAPLMGHDKALHVVSSANLCLHLARAFAERAKLDWYAIDGTQRRRYVELAKASIEALVRAEELLAAKEALRRVEQSVLREGGKRA